MIYYVPYIRVTSPSNIYFINSQFFSMITGAYLFNICAFVAIKKWRRSCEFCLYFNCLLVLKTMMAS